MEPTAASRSWTEGAPPDAIVVGRVVGAHGLRGGLRLRCFAGDPEPLLALSRIALARAESGEGACAFEVVAAAPGRSGELRVDLEGVRSREAAEAWKGFLVLAARSELPALPEGECWGYEIIGCTVEGEDGRVLGRVSEIWETGASDLLVVEGAQGARHLIPVAFVRQRDAERRRLVVELLPGLLDGE